MAESEISGSVKSLHHITVGVDGAQEDIDFITQVIGQRFLKATVLFDGRRPVYHLYYGDRIGRGGTIFTTFPWRKLGLKGRKGSGQINRTAFSVPEDSIDWWYDWLKDHGATTDPITERFGQRVIQFEHPSGLGLEIIGAADDRESWTGDGVEDAGHAVRGLHSVTLGLLELQNTKDFLELLGFRQTAEDGPNARMEVGEGGAGRTVDLHHQPDVPPGTWTHANGIHHHFAVLVNSEPEQLAIKDYLEGDGYVDVSEQKDRFYFKSIYVRSPGGVLMEVATPSNYLRDEEEPELGSHIMYPPWLEHYRGEWDPQLEPIKLVEPAVSA
jgi:glyoxalase family protein